MVRPPDPSIHTEMLIQPCLGDAEWFATQVRVGREHYSARHLQMRGYEVFLPCHRESRRWSDRVKHVSHPLFAGYLFCRSSSDVVGKIVTAPGVMRIVGDGTRAVPVPHDQIEAVRRIVDAGLVSEPWPFLQTGERVCIEVGPLRGLEGVVVRSLNGLRVVVSIVLLRRSVAVEVDAEWVRVQSDRRFASGPAVT